MTGRYYSVDYDEQYYIFDSEVITKDKVEMEAEFDYSVFGDSMSSEEIVEVMNESDELNKYCSAVDDTLSTIQELTEALIDYYYDDPDEYIILNSLDGVDIVYLRACFKAIVEGDIMEMDKLKKEIIWDVK